MSQPGSSDRIRFGVFELDLGTGELLKHGRRIRLQDQPFQVLVALVARPGQVVTREELRQRLWPGDDFGDFDQGLNRAINKVREALGDESENPRFVETLPKRGYRFIAPVEGPPRPVEPPPQVVALPRPPPDEPKRRWMWITGASLAVLALAGGVAALVFITPSPPVVRLRQITTDSEWKLWPVVTDGSRVYYLSRLTSGETRLMQAPVSGGRSTAVAFALPGSRAVLQDISPDGQELLMKVDNQEHIIAGVSPANLWAVRISDGSSRRVGAAPAAFARYSPDGSRIAWSTFGEKLYVGTTDGTGAREIVSMPGWRIVVGAWPAPNQIVLSCQEKKTSLTRAWHVSPDGSGLRRMLPRWEQSHVSAGTSPDGRFLLSSTINALWAYPISRLPGLGRTDTPIRIASSPPNLYVPYQTPTGRMITLGTVRLGELQRLDSKTKSWQRHLDGISADHVEYSPDGKWVVYVRYPEGVVWRCRAAGNECLQLTDAKRLLVSAQPHWSPDSTMIAFPAVETNKPTGVHVWLVNADGGQLRLAAPGYTGELADPAWMAGGKRLLVGASAATVVRGEPHSLQIVDIESGSVTGMPGTDTLWSPKSSADGSRLLALRTVLPQEPRTLTIYDNDSAQWRSAAGEYANYPRWSSDGKSIIYSGLREFRRFRLDNSRVEILAPFSSYNEVFGFDGPSLGQDPSGALLAMRNRSITQVYEIEFGSR